MGCVCGKIEIPTLSYHEGDSTFILNYNSVKTNIKVVLDDASIPQALQLNSRTVVLKQVSSLLARLRYYQDGFQNRLYIDVVVNGTTILSIGPLAIVCNGADYSEETRDLLQAIFTSVTQTHVVQHKFDGVKLYSTLNPFPESSQRKEDTTSRLMDGFASTGLRSVSEEVTF